MDLELLSSLKTDEEIKKFVDDAIAIAIKNNEHRRAIGMDNSSPYKGFIDKDIILTNVDADCKIESNRYAYLFFRGVSKFKVTDINTVVSWIYSFIVKYFGLDGDEEKRLQIYRGTKQDAPDISVLEGGNCAVCAERAAVAQNLFALLGVETYYMTGTVDGEPHAYNVINYNGKYILYDSAEDVPIVVDGKTTGYRYYASILSDEQLETLFNAGTIKTTGNRNYSSSAKYRMGIQK